MVWARRPSLQFWLSCSSHCILVFYCSPSLHSIFTPPHTSPIHSAALLSHSYGAVTLRPGSNTIHPGRPGLLFGSVGANRDVCDCEHDNNTEATVFTMDAGFFFSSKNLLVGLPIQHGRPCSHPIGPGSKTIVPGSNTDLNPILSRDESCWFRASM